MRKIEILGTGCSKCRKLHEQTVIATNELGLDCQIEKVEDIQKIMSYGVMMVPALVIDGEVKAAGKPLSVEKLKNLLTE